MGLSAHDGRRVRPAGRQAQLHRRAADFYRVHRRGVAVGAKFSFKPTRNVATDDKGRKVLTGSLDDDNHFRDYMGGFFPIILVVFVLRTFVAEPFQIPSSSMRPGLVKGDFILVNKFAYGIRTPVINNVLLDTGKVGRGDVVVFNYPLEDANYIKRAVGLPGDMVEYKDQGFESKPAILSKPTPRSAAMPIPMTKSRKPKWTRNASMPPLPDAASMY